MSTGALITPAPVAMPGLATRTTDRAAQGWVQGLPLTLDVGYVTGDKRFAVWLWNGTLAPVALADIERNDQSEGIDADPSPPMTITVRTAQRVDITVTIDGPLEFIALLTFASSCLFDPELTITGTRAPHLSGDVGYLFMPHNWQDGLDESLAWKTEVLIAHDRTEQRVKLRTHPRRTWNLNLLVAGAARRKLESWLGMRKTRFMFAPVWRDESRLSAPIVAGGAVLYIDDPQRYDYAVDRWVAVYDGWNHFEIRIVKGVGANYIAVDSPFLEDWPAGCLVAPCRYGLTLEQRVVSRFTEEVGDFRIVFEALHESLMPALATPEAYRSTLVCPLAPSWVNDAEETWDNKWIRLDNDTGTVEYDIQSGEPVIAREARFMVIGRAKIDVFLRFLFYCSGRLAPFWLAATDRGFELSQSADAGSNALIIQPIDYDFALSGSPARSHIELVTTGGETIRRMISAVETLPTGEEQWTLDNVLPIDVSAATLNRCAWLELVRLDSDSVNLKWWSGDCLEATLPIVVLP